MAGGVITSDDGGSQGRQKIFGCPFFAYNANKRTVVLFSFSI
jgi:hypothetical protein